MLVHCIKLILRGKHFVYCFIPIRLLCHYNSNSQKLYPFPFCQSRHDMFYFYCVTGSIWGCQVQMCLSTDETTKYNWRQKQTHLCQHNTWNNWMVR
jgi:hypothetical protein